jgi:hypothetical protein
MRTLPIFLALACACAVHPEQAPTNPPTAVDPLAAALASIRADDLATHVRTLASDRFEGRFPGTGGEVKTYGWDDYKGRDVAGKLVIVVADEPQRYRHPSSRRT